jgi:D-alanyl-D-alanine carboxypeptidase/D-alanyl-D-alanine-endopeptidase (penicillin-binding protein 4)
MRKVLLVLLTASLIAGVAAAVAGDEGRFGRRGRSATVELVTPVLSIRRFAPVLVDLRARTKLMASLDAIVDDPSLAAWGRGTCLVALVGDRVVYSRRADKPVIPASTLKLLTATAALRVLGPSTRLTTLFKADRAAAGGVIFGDLQVVGGGDPIIETDEAAAKNPRQPVVRTAMEDLAKAIQNAGITHVTGGIRADESRYDAERSRPGWKAAYQQDGDVAPLSALLVDDGQMTNGNPAPNPALHFAQTLAAKLRTIGVAVDGQPSVGKAGTGPVVASVDSLPVEDLVAELLRESDNTTAELLVKEMGRRATGGDAVGTTDAGLRAARTALAGAGLDLTGLDEKDGSGLDRTDRATCSLLAGSVAKAGRRSLIAESLPLAGKTGTLQKRFVGTSVDGRLRAKTGTLNGVSALAGWVDPVGDGAPLAFAVVSNDVPTSLPVTKLADKVGIALGAWPAAPPAADVDPEPVRPVAAGSATP